MNSKTQNFWKLMTYSDGREFLEQTGGTSCGPVAVLNAVLWATNNRITGSSTNNIMRKLHAVAPCSKVDGTTPENFEKLLSYCFPDFKKAGSISSIHNKSSSNFVRRLVYHMKKRRGGVFLLFKVDSFAHYAFFYCEDTTNRIVGVNVDDNYASFRSYFMEKKPVVFWHSSGIYPSQTAWMISGVSGVYND